MNKELDQFALYIDSRGPEFAERRALILFDEHDNILFIFIQESQHLSWVINLGIRLGLSAKKCQEIVLEEGLNNGKDSQGWTHDVTFGFFTGEEIKTFRNESTMQI